MKKLPLTILFLFSFLCVSAQQVGMFSHYFFKPMVYNPAFTGNDEQTNAMLINRSQWTGFKGAPQLNIFTLDGSVLRNKAGIGINLLSDRKGIVNRLGGSLNYSYRLNINDDMYLRFGISAGVIDQSIDYSKAMVENISDPFLFNDQERKTFFDANAGLAFFWKGLEFGFAAPQLLGNKIQYVDNTNVRAHYSQVRHYMGSLKYKFAIAKDKKIFITPLALVRYVPGAPLQYDGTINFEWQDKFWIGATYKSDYAVSAHTGICLHKQFYIGYAYDIIINDIAPYSGISHEIMMNFKFGKSKEAATDEKEPEKPVASNDEYKQVLDSLKEVVQQDREKIRENNQKIMELSQRLEEQSKQISSIPQQQNQGNQNNQQAGGNQQSGNQQPEKVNSNTSSQQPDKTATDNHTQSSNPNAIQNENQNSTAVETNANKVMNDGVWLVTNSAKEFKDGNQREPQKSFYVVSGTFIYRDFAETEVKRLISKGYKANWVFLESKQYNYVYIFKTSSKDEAIKKAKQVKAGEIKDAWVLQITE